MLPKQIAAVYSVAIGADYTRALYTDEKNRPCFPHCVPHYVWICSTIALNPQAGG